MHTFFKSLPCCITLLIVLPATVQAQNADNLGNYYRNDMGLRSPNSKYSTPGSLWRVMSENLNCRRAASFASPIVRSYLKDTLLEVEVYRGGSDEVLVNPVDENTKPWMPVRGKNAGEVCYVRANSRYIQPVTNIK